MCFLGLSGYLTLAKRDHLCRTPAQLSQSMHAYTHSHIRQVWALALPSCPEKPDPVSSFRPLTPALGWGGAWVFTLPRFLWSCFAAFCLPPPSFSPRPKDTGCSVQPLEVGCIWRRTSLWPEPPTSRYNSPVQKSLPLLSCRDTSPTVPRPAGNLKPPGKGVGCCQQAWGGGRGQTSISKARKKHPI